MGVVVAEVTFDGRAPELSRIADKVTELSGLPVSVAESAADVKADMYDLHGQLAFACSPKAGLEVRAYRPGAVREFCRSMFGDGNMNAPIARHVQGLNEAPGTQAVHLKGFIGQEPTLLFMTILALEALGGRPRNPLDDETRREYGMPITPKQLRERERKLARQMWPTVVVWLLLLPFLIPLLLIAFVVMIPWKVRNARRLYRNIAEGETDAGRTRGLQ